MHLDIQLEYESGSTDYESGSTIDSIHRTGLET